MDLMTFMIALTILVLARQTVRLIMRGAYAYAEARVQSSDGMRKWDERLERLLEEDERTVHGPPGRTPLSRERDCWEILGLERHRATTEHITRAYWDKARITHPDKGGDEAEFKRLGEAREEALAALARQ